MNFQVLSQICYIRTTNIINNTCIRFNVDNGAPHHWVHGIIDMTLATKASFEHTSTVEFQPCLILKLEWVEDRAKLWSDNF